MNGQRWTMLSGASILVLSLLGGCSGNDASPSTQTIQVGGSSETLEVIKIAAAAYEAAETGVEIEFLPPSQSSGGLEGIKANILDIGAVSSEPPVNEIASLQYVPLVRTPLVVITHETVTNVDNLTTEQLQGIYGGTITNWQTLGGPDAEIVLLDIPEDENEKILLREKVLGKELQVSDQAVVFPEDDEVLETATATPYSIATIPLEAEVSDAPVNTLNLDGIAPSPDSIESGAYTMVLPLGIVVTKKTTPAVQAFIDFMLSSEGQDILANSTELEAEAD